MAMEVVVKEHGETSRVSGACFVRTSYVSGLLGFRQEINPRHEILVQSKSQLSSCMDETGFERNVKSFLVSKCSQPLKLVNILIFLFYTPLTLVSSRHTARERRVSLDVKIELCYLV